MIDAPYDLDLFQRITDCNFGADWIQVKAQYLAGGAVESVNMSVTFPGISGGTPGFQLMSDGFLPALPLFSQPMTAAELSATATTLAGRKLTGFGRRLPATPPPAKPGGTTGYWFKINGQFPNTGDLRIRINLSGVVSGSWSLSVATSKLLRPGMAFDDPDFVSFQSEDGSTGAGDVPPAATDFLVKFDTLQVTLL